MNRSTVRAGSFRRSVAALGVMSLIAFSAVLILAGPAAATPFTGGLSPTVINNLLDLNGDNEVTGADDSNAFYGDTAIINGGSRLRRVVGSERRRGRRRCHRRATTTVR